MKHWLLGLVILSIAFNACKKKSKPDDSPGVVNWEIVRNFHEDDSYEGAQIEVHNGEIFFSTFGHRGISPGSSGSLSNQLKSTFFYKIGADWYRFAPTDEAVTNLKVFNGKLYGIRLLQPIKSTQPVLSHYFSYVLFTWENNNFNPIDTIEYTDNNHIEKANIGAIHLWENADKLHVVAANAHTARVWELNGNSLIKKTEEWPMSYTGAVAQDNKEVAFTQVIQVVQGQDRTIYNVRGHYYNGASFSTGTEYTFIQDIGFDGIEANTYAACNSSLWGVGFENYKFKNYDNNQVLTGSNKEEVLRGDIWISKNGKLYFMQGYKQNPDGCSGLAIFDGTQIREMDFVLPEPLDPCSKLIDATEENGIVYLLLMNRFQYVIVKSK